MWRWRHVAAFTFIYMTVVGFIIGFRHYSKTTDQNFQLDCSDPLGDGTVICHFPKMYHQESHFNITTIEAVGKIKAYEIQQYTNIALHTHNMPEYMPGNLDIFFPKLEELHITHSVLKYLNRYSFKYMIGLLLLNLDDNEISIIPSDTFFDLHSLVFLRLNGNRIKELSPPLVDRLLQLHTFSAAYNKISRIDTEFFRRNGKIEWIYLAGNKIEALGIDFQQFRNLKAVDLRRNSKRCNFLFNLNVDKNFTVAIFQKNVTDFCSAKI